MIDTGRIAALVAIAAVALATGLLWLSRGDDVQVPAGATAGRLTSHPCRYHGLNADCGTLVVRENRNAAGSRLIALPVTRVQARAAHPAEPIFRLEGGPGRSNMAFAYAGRYTARHDLVLVGYRGVDGSSRLDCPEVVDARRHSADLAGSAAVRDAAAAFGRCADRLTGDGADLRGYTITQRVEDLEDARRALGYDRVDLLSESAGTRYALVYGWRHPERVHRSVMVGVNPPGGFLYDAAQTPPQLARLGAMCHRPGCVAPIARAVGDLPDRWGPFPIQPGNVRLASFFGLMDASPQAAPISAPMALDAWRAYARGDRSGLWFQSFAAALVFPRSNVWGDSASMARVDAAAARRYFASRDASLAGAANRYLWAGGGMTGRWPASHEDDRYATLRRSGVETLLVSGEVDGATPPGGRVHALLRQLPNGHQVVLPGFGHTTDFWTQQVRAGTRLVTAFLDRGAVDDSLYVRERPDFTPARSQPLLAKATISAMALFALIAAGTLVALCVRRRRFGPKASAYLRSVHAAVVALGSWLLAALVTMVLLPDMPIDEGALVVLSAGAAAGFVVGRVADSPVAVPGAIAGAWLGFHAPGSALGVLTAIPAAVAAANLAVIAWELSAPRSTPLLEHGAL